MKPWEHPAVKKALQQLQPVEEKTVTLDTPEGRKPYRATLYRDQWGNEYLELRPFDPSEEYYILIPTRVLKDILRDAQE